MRLEGSCECEGVRFTVSSKTPYPYRICYCRRCRKTAGAIGAAANIVADADTLVVKGEITPTRYEHPEFGMFLTFCGRCGSPLFLDMPTWPQWVYPFAAAVDTELPTPPYYIHVRTEERQSWVPTLGTPDDRWFDDNTDESMVEWHERMGLVTPD